MKPSEYLAEQLVINGVLRYDSDRGTITTQTQGPTRSRSELFTDLETAIAVRDRYNIAIESMENFLKISVDTHTQ